MPFGLGSIPKMGSINPLGLLARANERNVVLRHFPNLCRLFQHRAGWLFLDKKSHLRVSASDYSNWENALVLALVGAGEAVLPAEVVLVKERPYQAEAEGQG